MRFRPLSTATATLALTAALTTVPPSSAQEVTAARAGGPDRYGTAATAMTQVAHPSGTNNAVIATGTRFPDALAAAALAGQADAALLLTRPSRLPDATTDALDKLGVENIYVAGGRSAVNRSVVQQLRGSGRDVSRVAGQDRYGTAARIARETVRLGPVARVSGSRAAFVTTGEAFADAVSAGAPAAAGNAAPVLLTRSGSVPRPTRRAIDDLAIGHVWVLGGRGAVSRRVVRQLENMGVTVDRVAGHDRQATAAAVAREFVDSGRLDGDVVTLARGDAFPDALVGGVTAAATSGPVLLTRSPSALGEGARSYLAAPAAPISVVRAMGGRAAVSRAVLQRAVEVAEGAGATPQSWTLAPQEALTLEPGGVADFTLWAEQGGQLPRELYVVLFDCAVVDATGDRRFDDRNDDGFADGYGTTGTGAATITRVNGNDVEDTKAVTSARPAGGELTFRLRSPRSDCAVPVVWQDTRSNGELDVDEQGRVVEPYNLGQVRWR